MTKLKLNQLKGIFFVATNGRETFSGFRGDFIRMTTEHNEMDIATYKAEWAAIGIPMRMTQKRGFLIVERA